MPAHTLARIVIHPFDGWERGNVFHVCELADHPQGGYWIRNHRTTYGTPNSREVRHGWARWTPDEGHMGERSLYSFLPVRNTHPDELKHLVGRKVVELRMNVIYAGRDVELAAVLDRTQPSPISEGRLTKAAILAATHGVNFGRNESDVIEEMRRG